MGNILNDFDWLKFEISEVKRRRRRRNLCGRGTHNHAIYRRNIRNKLW